MSENFQKLLHSTTSGLILVDIKFCDLCPLLTISSCDKTGHMARDCPEERRSGGGGGGGRSNNMDNTKCYRCHEYGHFARDCTNDDGGHDD